MNKHVLALIVTLAASLASAQDLVPATSEDIDMFDRQLQAQKEKSERTDVAKDREKGKADAFGQIVREEAQKLKDEDKKGFGAKTLRDLHREVSGKDPVGGGKKSGITDTAPSNPDKSNGNNGNGNGSGNGSGNGNGGGNGNGHRNKK